MVDVLLPHGKGLASANELFYFGNLQRSYKGEESKYIFMFSFAFA